MKNQFQVGDLVVVAKLPDAQVYRITQIEGFNVELEYEIKGHAPLSGGWIDISVLKEPTKAQLANHREELK